MKTNKIIKWLYGVFMFLPMLAIGVTCAYVTFNKNAKDSYYGETINEKQYISTQTNNLTTNDEYVMFEYPTLNESGWQDYFIRCEDINIIQTNTTIDTTNIAKFGFYVSTNRKSILFYTNDNNLVREYYFDTTPALQFSFRFITFEQRYTFNHTEIMTQSFLYEIEYNKYSYLDNAFYYAVDQFNESGFNKIDFVSFFDMFYNNTNIWTTFANTYMNYVLFVSLAFFIPRVLYWFINIAFSLTDGFERKSQGW